MGDSTTVRLARPGDERRIEAFLERHADSSLFLRSHLRGVALSMRASHFRARMRSEWMADRSSAWPCTHGTGSSFCKLPKALLPL